LSSIARRAGRVRAARRLKRWSIRYYIDTAHVARQSAMDRQAVLREGDHDGIRHGYRGWTFDTDGRCTDRPSEPNRGGKGRSAFRQPWYPLEER
jgi:hypothetical protein